MQTSTKKKVLIVFGTRPEAIKMAPLVKEFEKHPESFETVVAVTGQHREMLDQVLSLFEIVPDYDLNIMKKGQDLYDVTSRVLLGMRDVLRDAKPDVLFVHGDTTTSTASALAGFYEQIPVAHIEAGLRTYNRYSPWPEEMNRQLTGRLATMHFAPTQLSRENLLSENVSEEQITVTGNTVIDALYWVLNKIESTADIEQHVVSTLDAFGLPDSVVSSWKPDAADARKLVLITGHRRENFGGGFLNICNAIKALAERYADVDFVYPMHLNPNVRKPIQEVFERTSVDATGKLGNVHFIEPLDYLPFVYLMNKSSLVLTDSGGIQEEAPGLGKPVLVMRDTTERPEALDAGTVRLVGTDQELIVTEVSRLLDEEEHYLQMSRAHNPYGDGHACERVVQAVKGVAVTAH
ncbi:UDP-N-acetylglucosamine 2-epimerase [Prosthecochloris sp. CIB 2401]|nr:UDP-N-acetylglucosamine 2-epimerase (non-hydrolyzing) [Prosthecochloris sp. CIB 2401]ANT65151.1 UDP-N-acetylglucosamine 2-epimerase [Prosthecochloris sp. CIB 2401]